LIATEGYGVKYTGVPNADQALEVTLLTTTAMFGGSFSNPSGVDIYTSGSMITPKGGSYTYVSTDCWEQSFSTVGIVSACRASSSTVFSSTVTNLRFSLTSSYTSVFTALGATPT
jgi:hypothetical protein